jgi:hypothetical protein
VCSDAFQCKEYADSSVHDYHVIEMEGCIRCLGTQTKTLGLRPQGSASRLYVVLLTS